ncbi:MAG TPA: ABC transporter ATP-binding protein [Acidimicrobiales bacterium]|nr:ABC transporter ATP-binding protein [Acidimicrobiales bacterium]
MTLAVEHAVKTFRARQGTPVRALDGLDLVVAAGELVVVVGPSGSGKSTLLRVVAGLEGLDAGRIRLDGRDVTELPAGDRHVAMVFQDFALYPHLSVADNIGFGLRARRTPADVRVEAVARAAGVLGIAELLDRRPHELSGGERQRVALARAIVRRPVLFLLDEPLSNLDAELRAQARAEIKAVQRNLGTAMVYVTHDQLEAMTLADRVVVMRGGKVEQVGTPTAVYDHPASPFVGRLFGTPPMNVVPADVLVGRFGSPFVGVRAEHVRLTTPEQGRVVATVVAVEPIGADSVARVVVAGHSMAVRVGRRCEPCVGVEVGLCFDDADLHGFAEER